MRRASRLLAGAACLLALLLAAAAFVPPRLDWSRYRDTVESLASAGLGRPVHIAGPLRVSLLPQARLVASGVTLDGSGDGSGATVAEMRLRIGLGALLAGRIEVRDLLLHGADLRLPWPPAAGMLQQRPPAWLTGLHARLQDSRLHLGGMDVRGIDGALAVDEATGNLSASGVAEFMGRTWRVAGRLGRPGRDGAATLGLSVDGQGAVQDTGGTLSGQVAADGSLSGQVTARGPDLSLLLAAPSQPWRADGRFSASGGLAVADDLDLEVGAMPARGAVAVRLLPAARVDAALAASRIDLDAWLPPLLRGGAGAVPTGVDLSAEVAGLGGGLLRQLRVGFDLSEAGATVRDADAILPGNAALHLAGRVTAGQFAGTGTLNAPNLSTTLQWLRPRAPTLLAAVPDGALHAAKLSADVTLDTATLGLGRLRGQVDGAPVTGDLAVRGGDRPAVAATVTLADPVLDPWLPDAPPDPAAVLPALATAAAGFDADLQVSLARPVLRGTVLDSGALDLRMQAGTLELRRAALAGGSAVLSASGVLAPGGSLTDARLDLSTPRAAVLAPLLPPRWGTLQGVLRGPASLRLTASGEPTALATTVAAELSDARLQLSGRADLARRRWSGSLSLRHPGAPRLLAALGLTGTAAWLGDGSLSVQTQLDASPGRLAVTGLEASAGALRATATLVLAGLDAQPVLSGQVAADTLTVPMPYVRSADPWPVAALRGWAGHVELGAGRVLMGLSPVMEQATATASLDGGVLRLDHVAARVAGGSLAGNATLDAASPPRLAVTATLNGAVIAGPLLDDPIDLTAGTASASVRLGGSGYSPSAILATLSGEVTAGVEGGTLTGMDAGAALAAADPPDPAAAPAQAAAAFAAGTTRFTRLDAAATVSHGIATLQRGTLALPGGTGTLSGSLDLPGDAIDLRLALRVPRPGTPDIALRLIGPAHEPKRTPELAGLARYLATR